MMPVLNEKLDLNFLNSAARKILENSGLSVSENTDELSRISFFARTSDQSKTIAVSCRVDDSSFAVDEQEKLVAEASQLKCDSFMVISSSTFSPEESGWAEKHGVSLVDGTRFLQTFKQLPEHIKAEIENTRTQTQSAPEEVEPKESVDAVESTEPEASPEVAENADIAENIAAEVETAGSTADADNTADNPADDEESEDSEAGHHQPLATTEEPVKKKKRWVPVVIILVVLLVVLPVVGTIASIAIPTIIALTSDADKIGLTLPPTDPPKVKPSIPAKPNPGTSKTTSPPKPQNLATKPGPPAKPGPKATKTPVSTVKVPQNPAKTPQAPAKATTTPKTKAPPSTVKATTPPKTEVKTQASTKVATPPKQNSKPPSLTEVKMTPDAPIWKTTGQPEVRKFLYKLWKFDRLVDDPFFDLSENILIQNTVKPGPLDGGTEMAMYVLPRKLAEYPELGCAALTILSPDDREQFFSKLNSPVRQLKDPLLLLQFLALKAESSNNQAEIREAMGTLETVLNPENPKPLSDHVAFYLLSKDFVRALPESAPDQFLTIATESPVVPAWLKDYLRGEKLWRELESFIEVKESAGNSQNPATEATVRASMQAMANHYESSWKANPGHPAAAAKMIEVENGMKEKSLPDFRKWFDRSTRAQADYAPAYRIYLKVLAMRETSSKKLSIDFGKSCVATGRFDTVVPLSLIDAHVFRCYVKGQPVSEYWSTLSDDDLETIETLFTGLNKSDSLVHGGATEKSMEALVWFLIGQEKKSLDRLKKLGTSFDFNAMEVINMEDVDRGKFKEFLQENELALTL